MGNTKRPENGIIEYAQNNRASFDVSPFNEVDGLIFAQLSYLPYDDCGIDLYTNQSRTIGEIFTQLSSSGAVKGNNLELLESLANNPRYSKVTLSNFVRDPVTSANPVNGFSSVGDIDYMEQFSAVTISYNQNGETTHFISFSGTNGTDDGWSEDVALLCTSNTQANADAASYLNIISDMIDDGTIQNGYIDAGGHSKGDNDTRNGYLTCSDSARQKIRNLYGYDGPGNIDPDVLSSDVYKEYIEKSKGHIYAPQDSLVGQLLRDKNEPVIYVHSVESGFMQHDPYSWEIDKSGYAFTPDDQSDLSKYINESITSVAKNMTSAEKDAFFSFISYLMYCDGYEGDDGGIGGLGKFFTTGWKNEVGSFDWWMYGSFNWKKFGELWNVISADLDSMSPEEREAFINSLGTVASSFIATGYDYAKDKVEVWFNQKVEQFERKIQEAYTYVSDWAIEKRDQFIGFMTSVYDAFVAGLSTVMSVLKLLDSNYRAAKEYLENADLLQFHTDDLRDLASRLWAINGRLENLDKRIDSLYSKVKWRDLWSLINADFKIGWSSRLNRCANCLNDTAGRFESVEQQLLQMLE